MNPAVDKASRQAMAAESSGDVGDLSPYRVVKLKSPQISSLSGATSRMVLMNSW